MEQTQLPIRKGSSSPWLEEMRSEEIKKREILSAVIEKYGGFCVGAIIEIKESGLFADYEISKFINQLDRKEVDRLSNFSKNGKKKEKERKNESIDVVSPVTNPNIDAFEKLKSALNDALEDGYINQKFVEMITENPGSVEKMIKLTRELNMLTHGKGYEKQQERHVNHVNQSLTRSGCERDNEMRLIDLSILKLLLESDQSPTQKEIIAEMGKSRPAIWKSLTRLGKKGLIESTKRGSFKYYSITEKGKSFPYDQHVNPVHTGMKMWVRRHGERLKGDLIGKLPNHMDEWKVYFTTWKGHFRRFYNDGSTVTVNLTTKSAILYLSVAPCSTLDEAETTLGNLVGWIIKRLAREGIYVKNLRQNTKASYALIYDPIAERFYKHRITYDGSTFSIDHSHDVPETEFHTKEGLERLQKFVSYVDDRSIDPEILLEMLEEFKAKKNRLLNNYDEDFVLPMIPYEDTKVLDFVNRYENNNKVVDTLYNLEKKGEITASNGYMRRVY